MTLDALNTCNICDIQIEQPNPMGYCNEHLQETKETQA